MGIREGEVGTMRRHMREGEKGRLWVARSIDLLVSLYSMPYRQSLLILTRMPAPRGQRALPVLAGAAHPLARPWHIVGPCESLPNDCVWKLVQHQAGQRDQMDEE